MADPVRTATPSAGRKVTPGQWKLIAALASVLFLLNYPGSEGQDTTDTVAEGTQSTVAESRESSVSGTDDLRLATGHRREIPWPDVPLEFLLANNPFRPESALTPGTEMPETSPDDAAGLTELPAEAESEGLVDQEQAAPPYPPRLETPLTGRKLQFVFRGPRGTAAMIDDKIYHEGDRLDQFEIGAITSDRVTLRVIKESATP